MSNDDEPLPPPEVSAYTAGLIDGEGCINISSRMPAKSRKMSYNLNVIITNTDGRMMDWLKEVWKCGSVHTQAPGPGRPHKSYTWRVSNDAAACILILCRPYLVIKREQADAAIEFRRFSRSAPRFDMAAADQREEHKNILHGLKDAFKVPFA